LDDKLGKEMTKLVCKQVETPAEKSAAEKWDCTRSMYPKGPCWAADVYQQCHRLSQGANAQWAYDRVNGAGGNTKEAWEVYSDIVANKCTKKAAAKKVETPLAPMRQKHTCGGGTTFLGKTSGTVVQKQQSCVRQCQTWLLQHALASGCCQLDTSGNSCRAKAGHPESFWSSTAYATEITSPPPSPCVQGSPESTVSPAPSPVDSDAVIVCGSKKGNCPKKVDIASKTEGYAVRCCSDSLISGWMKHAQCDVWAESDLPSCYNAKTFSEAEGICSSNNARLCTEQEILDDCSQGSGCGFDWRQVWVLG